MITETYPEMNTKIVGILRWGGDDPMALYAAQRIEELEAEVEQLQHELHDEQVQRRWKRDTRCKLTAIWYILTNRSVIYNLYFDKEHPLTLAPRNMTPDTLVTRCEFDGVGVAPDDFHKAPGISERLEKCKMRKANDH